MTDVNAITRKNLLALPHRKWSETKDYRSLVVFPTGVKHDSNYGCMTIIGCQNYIPAEIITEVSDDISIDFGHRVDCLFAAKALHFWSRTHLFRVGAALSSIEITGVLI